MSNCDHRYHLLWNNEGVVGIKCKDCGEKKPLLVKESKRPDAA